MSNAILAARAIPVLANLGFKVRFTKTGIDLRLRHMYRHLPYTDASGLFVNNAQYVKLIDEARCNA